VKLTAPGFGPGLKPLVHLQFGRRHAAWHPLAPLNAARTWQASRRSASARGPWRCSLHQGR